MKEGLPQNSEAGTTQDAHPIPQPREHRTEAAAPQTTTGAEADCADNLDSLRRDNDEKRTRFEPTRVRTLRNVGAAVRRFMETNAATSESEE